MINLYSNTLKVVSAVFKDAYGYEPKNIRDSQGRPPEESNSYLFNLALSQFEGVLTGKYAVDYEFKILYDHSKKDWSYTFDAM